ncbi:MAG: DHA1 family multidrug resistance protein-like MFS transporter [Planctomycetota bacterium]|jgi:DHA1 family multidrug resistance protein-like MFS transporter
MGAKASWRRTFFVVWLANLITAIGMMSFLPFFPSLLRDLGVEGQASVRLWAGVCFGAAPLSATIMSPIWGALGDRLGRKLMVVRSMLAIAFFVGAMAYVQTPLQLLAMRLGQGLFSGFIPPSITLVSVAAPAERQGRIAGYLTTSLAIGGMLGPLLGGWISIRSGSHQNVFHVVGALALLGAVLVALFAVEDKSLRRVADKALDSSPVRSALSALRGDMRDVLGNPVLRGAAGLVFALQLGMGAVNPVLEEYVVELFRGLDPMAERWSYWLQRLSTEPLDSVQKVSIFATSLSFGAMAIANLVFLPLWGRYGDLVGHRRALRVCALGSVASLLLQASVPSYPALLVGRFLMGAALAGVAPLAFGLAATVTVADRRGGAFGAVFSARTLAVAVGGATGGALAGVLGVRAVMAISCVPVGLALYSFAKSRKPQAKLS